MATKPPTDPAPLELYNLGQFGIIKDIKPHLLPPEAWSNGRNVRFNKNGVSRFQDYAATFDTPSVAPEFIFNVPSPSANFWLYASLTKIYAYDGSTHTNVTRQTASVDVDYTPSNGRDWQGTILGSVPILNNNADLPQYWTGLSTGNKMANLTGWPSTLRAKIIKAFGPYLIALNLTDNGTPLQKTIRWSSFADPGTLPASWDYTDPTVDAAQTQLTDDKGGQLLDAVLLGNQMIMYTENATHTLKYVGGVAIFSPDLLLKESGILATHCACAFNKGTAQLVLTSDDIIIHQGTQSAQSIVQDKDRDTIFAEIDTTNYANSFVFENTKQKEVWICYPSTGNTRPNVAAVYNYKDNTMTFKDIAINTADTGASYAPDSTTWAADAGNWSTDDLPWNAESRNTVIVASAVNTAIYKLDVDYTTDNVCSIERTGLAIDGKDRAGQPKGSTKTTKQCNRMWLKTVGSAILSVRMGSQETIDGPVTWATAQSFNCATDKYLDWTVVGKLLAYRIENSDGLAWTLEGIDLEIEVLSQL